MFKFLNPDGRNAHFSVDDDNASVLHVDSFNFKAGVKAAAKDFDFSRHQECTYRQVYDGTDENGMEKTRSVAVPPDLNDAVITIFALPEEEK